MKELIVEKSATYNVNCLLWIQGSQYQRGLWLPSQPALTNPNAHRAVQVVYFRNLCVYQIVADMYYISFPFTRVFPYPISQYVSISYPVSCMNDLEGRPLTLKYLGLMACVFFISLEILLQCSNLFSFIEHSRNIWLDLKEILIF